MKSVCVTGADGIVGKRLVAKLAEAKLNVSAIVRTPREKAFFDSLGVTVFVGSPKDAGFLNEALKGSDAVIHLIGSFQADNGASLDDINNTYTYQVYTAAEENKVGKFIFLSAYGASPGIQNEYLVSKGNAEVDIMQGEIPYVIIRSTPIYSEESPLGLLMKDWAGKGSAPLIGSGKQKLQPIYVDDVVEYIYQALMDPATRQQVLEVGGPDKVTYEELVQKVGETAGKEIKVSRVPALFKAFSKPVLIDGKKVSKEQLDFYSRDSFVSVERAGSVIPVQLTSLSDGLKKSL